MRRSGTRISAVVGAVLLAGAGLVVLASPASAQDGATAAVRAAGPTAVCPPGGVPPAASVPDGGTINGVQFSGVGQCTTASARADGYYTVIGDGSGQFASRCAGDGTTQGGVFVPAGSTVNGALVGPAGEWVTGLATVVFPNGRTATVNQVAVGPTSVTRTAIAFEGGPTLGVVTCNTVAAYPLSVDPSIGGASPVDLVPSTAEGEGGSLSNLALLGGGLALVVLLAQVAVARRVRRTGS